MAGRSTPIKLQLTGPVTLGIALLNLGVPADRAFAVADASVRARAATLLAAAKDTAPMAPLVVFVDEPGLTAAMHRDFPLDQNALRASMIAHCAGEDRYPQFVEVFFAQQASWARAEDPVQALKQLAQLGGLSADKVDACLADKALEEAILQARLDGQEKYEIKSTPSFIIDGKTYAGDQGVEKFVEIIEPLVGQ